jgi:hypothetical protein
MPNFVWTPPAAFEPLREIILDRLGRDFPESLIGKHRPQKFHGVGVLLMRSRCAKRRLGAPLEKPVGPLVEGELLASEHGRQPSVVAGIQPVPDETLCLRLIGCAGRFSSDLSFLVSIPGVPDLRVLSFE